MHRPAGPQFHCQQQVGAAAGAARGAPAPRRGGPALPFVAPRASERVTECGSEWLAFSSPGAQGGRPQGGAWHRGLYWPGLLARGSRRPPSALSPAGPPASRGPEMPSLSLEEGRLRLKGGSWASRRVDRLPRAGPAHWCESWPARPRWSLVSSTTHSRTEASVCGATARSVGSAEGCTGCGLGWRGRAGDCQDGRGLEEHSRPRLHSWSPSLLASGAPVGRGTRTYMCSVQERASQRRGPCIRGAVLAQSSP